MSKPLQVFPDTTGWLAVYDNKDSNEPSVYCPLVGWGLYADGTILALVPSTDGSAVPCQDMRGNDGELQFRELTCGHSAGCGESDAQ